MILLKEAIVRETGVLTAESKTKLMTNSKKLITTIVADYLMTPLVVARDSFGNKLRLSIKMMLESPL